MIVPNLKGVATGLVEPQNYTETLTSVVGTPSVLSAGRTGIFGRKSRHAAVANDTGPRRNIPTAVTTAESAITSSETLKVETSTSVASSSITTAPEIIPTTAELEKRQTSSSSTVSCPGGLNYVECTDGSFKGCATSGNICNITSKASTTSSGTAKSSPAASPTSTTASATNTTSTPAATSSAAPSAKTNVGAIAGGAIGGVAVLALALFLLAHFVRRHRKKIERRRLAEAKPFFVKTATPPPPLHQDRPSGHHRSGSTSNDIYGTMGGSSSRTKFHQIKTDPYMNSPQIDPAPGLRAERGPGLPPAAFLRPAQMLDGTPINEIGGLERPRSVRSVRSSKFAEHIAELPGDSSPPRSLGNNIVRQRSPLSQDSPILGRQSAFSSSTAASSSVSGVKRGQHALSFNTYASEGDGEEISATMKSSKAPPSARSTPSQISEQSGGQMLSDGTYVVSPLRKEKFERGRGSGMF